MLRLNVAFRQFPKNGFQFASLPPRTNVICRCRTDLKLLNSRKLSSAISNVKSAVDSRTNNVADKKSPQNDVNDLVSLIKRQQEALTLLTTNLHPIKSVLIKPNSRTSKSHAQSGPVIDREGYAVSSAMRAFIEACDVISEIPLALKSFRNIHSAIKKLKKAINLDVSLYHILLRSVSRRGLIQV